MERMERMERMEADSAARKVDKIHATVAIEESALQVTRQVPG
jgi:hypothetical protein